MPQRIDLSRGGGSEKIVCFFRAREERGKTVLTVSVNGAELLRRTYAALRPPEMERISLDLSKASLAPGDRIIFTLGEAN